ncbi:MAG: adenosine kinase [Rhodospirillaceae bacterium]
MTESHFDVVGIGNAIVDILAQADDLFLSKYDAPKGTMVWVDEKQSDAMYKNLSQAIEASGGSAANTMAGIASFGGRPAFIGKVNNDKLGKTFTEDIRAIGVHFEPTQHTDGLATARCVILVTPDAQRTMFTYLGASSLLQAEDMDADVITASKILYIEGYQWDLPETKKAIVEACEVAHHSGRQVALTLSDPFVVERHRNELLALADKYADIIFANEQEIIRLFNADSFEEAINSLKGCVDIAALTRGSHGAVTVNKDALVETPAMPQGKVIDTTGAGDMYAAGFLFGYTSGKDIKTCATLGALAAGEVICHMGARPKNSLRDLAKKSGY